MSDHESPDTRGPSIVLTGSPLSGYKAHGPFATVDDAVAWAKENELRIGFASVMLLEAEAGTQEREGDDAPAEAQDGQPPDEPCPTHAPESYTAELDRQHSASSGQPLPDQVSRLFVLPSAIRCIVCGEWVYAYPCGNCGNEFGPPSTANVTPPPHPLRHGAAALLVPWTKQPRDQLTHVEWRSEQVAAVAWWFDGEAFLEKRLVKPGHTIPTTLGPRKVVGVRAVDLHSWDDRIAFACGYSADTVSGWTRLKLDWDRDHPNCRWAWLVEVAE